MKEVSVPFECPECAAQTKGIVAKRGRQVGLFCKCGKLIRWLDKASPLRREAFGVPDKKGPREKSTHERIMDYINGIEGCLCRKRWGGPFGVTADPDLYGSLRGRHFEFEIKQVGEKPKPAQFAKMHDWEMAGALVGWFDRFEDAKRVVDESLTAGRTA